MGKKSKGTTKSGKFVNPTDRARKEERKRELKKNKKQRIAVRTAVIKGKDPQQILADLERLDQIEFNLNQPPILNEKVLTDKRRKLRDTWDRVMRLYLAEDKDQYAQLKRLESEYESRRDELKKTFEAVKSAENVSLDDIPLPSLPGPSDPDINVRKAPTLTSHRSLTSKKPPGPPPGPPPTLEEIEEVEDSKDRDVDDFLKEIEEVAIPTLPPPVINPGMVLVRPCRLPVPQVTQPTRTPGVRIPPPPSLLPPISHGPPTHTRFSVPHGSSKPAGPQDKGKPVATIEAKPQLRNLTADSTRFLPVSLRVKRNERQQPQKHKVGPSSSASSSMTTDNEQLKDEAYEQFMKELEGLL